ncbi:MAG: hypothetical protein R2807_06555 [Chitinophagales bacterium]
MTEKNISNAAVFLLLCVLSILFYGNSIKNGFALDDSYIFQQIPEVGSNFMSCFKVFKQRYDFVDYRPVAMFTFALEQWFLGEIHPTISHLINLILFVSLCFSIYIFIKQLPEKHATAIALICSILFLAHPIHANAVCNLKSRDTILGMLLSIWSIYYFTYYATSQQTKKKLKGYCFGILLFLLAVSTKRDNYNVLLIVPLTLIIYNLASIKQILKGLTPIIILVLILSIILNFYLPHEYSIGNSIIYTENPIVEKTTFFYQLSQAISTYTTYLKFMIIPQGYYFYFGYDMIPLLPINNIQQILYLLLHCSILLGAFILYKKEEKIGAYAILFFYATLYYCSNMYVLVAGIVADRYAFIASLGFCLFVAWFIIWCTDKYIQYTKNKSKNKKQQKGLSIHQLSILIALLISFIYLPFTWSRNVAWKDIISLMDKDIPQLTNSFQGNRIGATHYLNAARNEQPPEIAQTLYSKALNCALNADAVYKDDIFILESKALSYLGLGNKDSAYTTFAYINSITDSSALTSNMLGDLFYKRKSYDTATYFYHKLLTIDTITDIGYYKLISTLHNLSRIDGSFRFCDSIIQRRPSLSISYETKGYNYLHLGDTAASGKYMLRAFQLGMQSTAYANLYFNFYKSKRDTTMYQQFEPYLQNTNNNY